jgi:hypothetical protein
MVLVLTEEGDLGRDIGQGVLFFSGLEVPLCVCVFYQSIYTYKMYF